MKSMLFAALPALALAGCAGQTQDFPSLAPRPIENRDDSTHAPLPPAAQPAADAALIARIAQLADQAKTSGAAFTATLPKAVQAADAARGAVQGDERWVVAQQQLSALEAARAGATGVLAELDTLYLARLDAIARGESVGGADEIKAARADVERSAADQQAQIDAIRTRLNR